MVIGATPAKGAATAPLLQTALLRTLFAAAKVFAGNAFPMLIAKMFSTRIAIQTSAPLALPTLIAHSFQQIPSLSVRQRSESASSAPAKPTAQATTSPSARIMSACLVMKTRFLTMSLTRLIGSVGLTAFFPILTTTRTIFAILAIELARHAPQELQQTA